jgi:hypothetical protein
MSSTAAEASSQEAVPTDAFGTPIKVGTTVAHAVRKKGSMWLSKLVVQAISGDKVEGYDPVDVRQRKKVLSNTKNAVVLSQLK